ncbi:MAG: InlB B-repeat-containing protein, partial [Actinomycetes bacterium]
MKVKTLGFLTAALLALVVLSVPSLSNPASANTTSFTVTFDANGGSGVMPKQAIPAKGKALLSVRYVRDSHRFIGWSINRTGVVKYKDSSVIKPKSKLTLYAQWKVTVTKPVLLGYQLGKLLWSDSFTGSDGALIDSTNWTARYCGQSNGNGGGTCHNSEKQWYTPDAIRLDGT